MEEGGFEPCKDEVGEEIDIEDWWEELGGGQTEPVRSQVGEESPGESSVGQRVTDFEGGLCHRQGGFEQHYSIGAGKVQSREKGKLG
jgi:hypothetical protein